ncbi:site-specific DNA-methyltransferase [Pseudomonas syringae pv. actinidifoliorum]|uniref:DNA-methyltransferase n=1 Tax=Pseudomonas syringae TaxID=317 RepID=UPI001373273E|nr:site-specific DNA-methyltransferase [Pseudomonas syringae]NAS97443.1 site-specific DNA-methyltransferase [Pseudomonas syringae pv. actinidifoliorum]NAT62648.1 site-specific DNA-methyltransferase [Pseudomonas syringae pv. actinidifoliorum]
MNTKNFDLAKEYLGSPTYENEGVAIYNKECLHAMKALPSGIIDLTVTSPPYNIGKEYESLIETAEYVEWCAAWMNEIHRVSSSNGAFWLNLGYFKVKNKGLAVPISYLLWDKTPFYLLQEVVWNYAAGVACKLRFSPRNEKLLWYVKNSESYTFNLDAVRDPNVKYPNQKKNGKLKCNPLGKNPSDVWQIAKVTSGAKRSSKERTAHPAQFPTEMVERIIKSSSNESDLILDPFMGSGSTAIAALANKRKVIGFEINEAYVEIAKERIENYLNKSSALNPQPELNF